MKDTIRKLDETLFRAAQVAEFLAYRLWARRLSASSRKANAKYGACTLCGHTFFTEADGDNWEDYTPDEDHPNLHWTCAN